LTEKKLTFDKVDPLLLFGQNDVHLRKIEATFPTVKFIPRGNTLLLQGEEAQLNQLARILHELSVLLGRNQFLQANDIETVLDIQRYGTQQNGKPKFTDESDVILYSPSGEVIKAKTAGQRQMIQQMRQNDVVFSIGPAGTGKTYTAVALAVAALKARQVKRIVLSRPAVEAGESLGFLPGDLKDKIDPYLRPLYDALEDMIPREKLQQYLEMNIIEISPLAYMRGRTLNACFAILDEAQNATTTQMKMFLTRLGTNSRALITGDVTQTDLPRKSQSGLIQVEKVLNNIEGISFVHLDKKDVVRHKLVQDIIEAYDKFEESES
jgi:phosphate starvation-inducible protein PhoH and related proteins